MRLLCRIYITITQNMKRIVSSCRFWVNKTCKNQRNSVIFCFFFLFLILSFSLRVKWMKSEIENSVLLNASEIIQDSIRFRTQVFLTFPNISHSRTEHTKKRKKNTRKITHRNAKVVYPAQKRTTTTTL